ncbi:hypothetical protein ACP4OV_016321 [Aristida adscensionis]
MCRAIIVVFLQLVSLLLACSNDLAATAPQNLVTSLPGLDGALPFHLETGYVTVDEENGAELFYYFVWSEDDHRRDPVLLWLTGGDRCSVLSGLAFEIGPVKFIEEPYEGGVPRLKYNPYSWTKVASVLFVDWPVGAGFSFSRDPRGYDAGLGDVPATLHLKKFLTKWFTDHLEYLGNPFYVGGDSYAGKIVPFLAQMISEDIEAGNRPHLNLQGYLVGNPVTGELVDFNSAVPFAHGMGIISDQLYERITRLCQGEDYIQPKKASCAEVLDIFNYVLDNEISKPHVLYPRCIYVTSESNNERSNFITLQNRNILMEETGISRGPPPRPPIYCMSYKNYLSYFWANSDATRKALGIKKGSVDEWVRCHSNRRPSTNQDIRSSIKYHRNVTLKGYRSLVYSGDHDIAIPFLGTQAWVRSLNFSILDDWRAWHLDGQSAGFTITYSNNMTFATIKSGGHTAPEYQPERCFAMIQRWISRRPL